MEINYRGRPRRKRKPGVGLIILGIMLIMISLALNYLFRPMIEDAYQELTALPIVQYEGMAGSETGTEMLFNGMISTENETSFEDLIVYDYREYKKSGDRSYWTVIEQFRPSIMIELNEGHMINLVGDYTLYDYTKEYDYGEGKNSGIDAGIEVGIRGTKQDNLEDNLIQIKGTMMTPGTIEEYIEIQSFGIQVLFYSIYISFPLGLLFLCLGIIRMIKKSSAQ